jgi:bacteriocin biosynthesis cyclodehydratase domain-containing protein
MNVHQPIDDRKLALQRLQMIETSDGMLLKRGRAVVKIKGAESVQIVQALLAIASDGAATRQELCEPFPAELQASVGQLIDALEARHLLTDAEHFDSSSGAEEPIDVFFWHFDKRADQVCRAFEKTRITIIGVNKVSRQIVNALIESGVQSVEVIDYPLLNNVRMLDDNGKVRPEHWPASLGQPRNHREWFDLTQARGAGCLVVTSDFGGQHLLRDWNRHCVRERIPFLPVVLQDLVGRIGPLVVPGEGSCLECLRARENSHIDDPDTHRAAEYGAYEGQVVTAFHPSMASVLGDIAAMELLKLYGQFMRSRLVGRMIEVNLVVPELTERRVLKLPRCSVCGAGQSRSPVSMNKVAFMPGHEVAR